MCYNRFRYYHPETGRYISEDPIEFLSGEPNFFAYVSDTNAWVDLLGLSYEEDNRTSKDELRRSKKHDVPEPDPEAIGYPHTQLGIKNSKRRYEYVQAREFDADGNAIKDIDFTDHNRPKEHTNPHQHRYIDNSTGGTKKRGKGEPLDFT